MWIVFNIVNIEDLGNYDLCFGIMLIILKLNFVSDFFVLIDVFLVWVIRFLKEKISLFDEFCKKMIWICLFLKIICFVMFMLRDFIFIKWGYVCFI